ncbi:unnamed protein product [Didymodactylos carnosus]|uniref:RING-type domain-containing protein n=1 Tax=Didymodactylos carnosus TaxID=1234261 RepID=A0A814NN79_9BILA|nr:unnamed protein product [Didymodactylos carnosus]CAF1287700.1 unnamed protein product [Didymodactylos carnosus]CAF3861418.1 unnamed protein product [Didymodactylos carnosus]CAF4092695.1 unnamed protein product [Didymodactylos carnosus]
MADDRNSICKERVQSSIEEEYLCPLCYNLLLKPVECNNCQRVFCKQCIDKCLKAKPNLCPFCENYQEKRCSPMFYALLCKLKIECINKPNGCDQVLLYELIEEHETNKCLDQMKQCRGCLKNILKRDLDQHEATCDQIEIQCVKCSLIRKQNSKHDQFDCLSNKQVLLEQKIQQNEEQNKTLINKIQMAVKQLEIHNIENQQKIKQLEIANAESQEMIKCLKNELQWNDKFSKSDFIDELKKQISLSLLIEPFHGDIKTNIPLALLPQWHIIYDQLYSHKTTINEFHALLPKCSVNIIVGAISKNSPTVLSLAACGPKDILSLNTLLNQPFKHDNVYWYLTPTKSFGFSPTSVIKQESPDIVSDQGYKRLSWYLDSYGGYRVGNIINLTTSGDWRKVILSEKV